MRWHNGQIRRSPNPNPEEVFQDCLTKWEESVAHSILARRFLQQRPYTFAQTNLSLSFSFASRRRTIHSGEARRCAAERLARTRFGISAALAAQQTGE